MLVFCSDRPGWSYSGKSSSLLLCPKSKGHLMGATLSTLLRAVPGTIAMTDFRQGLRPRGAHSQPW